MYISCSAGNVTGYTIFLYSEICSTFEGKLGLVCTAPIIYQLRIGNSGFLPVLELADRLAPMME